MLEDEQYQRSTAYYKDVQKQFAWASNDIQMDIAKWYQRLADNNGISYAEAKKFLKESELEEFQWSVERYVKAGRENAVDQSWMKELENASARHHISYLEAMKLQVQQHAELLSTEFEGGLTDFLHNSYGNQYYHTAFEVAKGTGAGCNLAKLDNQKIDALIRQPWAQDAANFSDRIWTNKEKLVNNLHTELSQNIIRGAPPGKAIDNLAKTMEVSKRQAGTLIMTEAAAISSRAQQNCFKELGVEEFEVIETLDGSTCELCQEMDGKHYPMTDFKVGETAPPFHPRCRGCTCPYFDDEFSAGEERAARDPETGKTVYVDGNLNYPEWKEQFVNKAGEYEKVRTSDLEWNKSALQGMKPIASDVRWNSYIPECAERLMNAAHTELNKTMIEEHVEMLSIVEKGKAEIYYQKGEDIDAVTLSKETLNRLKKAPEGSIIFSHVHPGRTTFSQADIKVLVNFNSISDLTLECSDGTKYILGRGDYKSSFIHKMQFDTSYDAVYNEVAKKYPELDELDTAYDVWEKFMFEVNETVARKFGFVFMEVK